MRAIPASTIPISYVVVERWETRETTSMPMAGAAHEGLARIFRAAQGSPTVIEIISDDKVEKRSRRMIRATQVQGQHHWKDAPADTVVLDFDDRHRRRMAMTGTRGLEFLLDLENAVALRGGDALVLEDGRLVEVVAAPEPLIEIRCNDPQHLVRVAWHLGNRHLPTQIMAEGPADPARPRHRGDGEGSRRARDRDRGAVRSRRRRLCRRRSCPCARRPRPHAHTGHDHASHDHGHHDHHHHDEHCDHDHHHGHSHAHDHK